MVSKDTQELAYYTGVLMGILSRMKGKIPNFSEEDEKKLTKELKKLAETFYLDEEKKERDHDRKT